MTQIHQIRDSVIQAHRRPGMTRAFEARYCGSANETTSHAQNAARLFQPCPSKHVDVTKPKMWQKNGLWCCQLETVRGTGTTREASWSQLWALLSVTHPWLRKPATFSALELK